MDQLQGSTPELRRELQVNLFRYRHQLTRDQALAYLVLADFEVALDLLQEVIAWIPEGTLLGGQIQDFLEQRARLQPPAAS